MSDQTTRKSNNLEPNSQRSRRVLVVLPGKGSVLRSELIASGYETAAAQPESALSMVADYIPDVVIFELGGGPVEESDQHILALARRLRSEASTYALPLVFCDHMEDKSIRSSLIGLGADDYFSITTPIKETLARLDSLFWRIESGRRNASTSGDQRLDIDNFMLLLDSVRDDIRAGLKGTIGLIYAASPPGAQPLDRANRDRSLTEINGFLKLNIRQADSVTFYGPTTLLIYMPGVSLSWAAGRTTNLHSEFRKNFPDRDFAAGLADFRVKTNGLEVAMERAEAGAALARRVDAVRRVEAPDLTDFPQVSHVEAGTPAKVEPPIPDTEEPIAPVSAAVSTESPAESVPLVQSSIKPSDAGMEFVLHLDDELEGGNTVGPQTIQNESEELEELTISAIPPTVGDSPEPENNSIDHPATTQPGPNASPQIEALAPEAPENIEPANPTKSSMAYETPVAVARPDSPEPAGEKFERKTFFEKGFDSSVTSELTMADIMEKVAATRPRVADTETSAPSAHEVSASEMRLREKGEPMFQRLLLVISDTKRMAAMNALVRAAGYEVRASFSGRQALDLLRLERPELVLIDYRLNAMDGLETIKRLRSQTGGRLTTPIILLAPEDETDVWNDAVALGVTTVTKANYDPADLLLNIRVAASKV